jgi:hypothetical protein
MTEYHAVTDPDLEDGQTPAPTTDDTGTPEAGETDADADAERGTAVDLPDYTEPDPDPGTGNAADQ